MLTFLAVNFASIVGCRSNTGERIRRWLHHDRHPTFNSEWRGASQSFKSTIITAYPLHSHYFLLLSSEPLTICKPLDYPLNLSAPSPPLKPLCAPEFELYN